MRLYLDTNILFYVLTERKEEIDRDTFELLFDYSNTLYTCTVCVHELIYLRQTKRIETGRDWKKTTDVVQRISDFGITITTIDARHLKTEEQLPLIDDKCDPNDRLIIAQAIADKAMLVSSDNEFPHYVQYGLQLHRNIKSKRNK